MSYGDLVIRELGLTKDVFRLSDPLVATGDYGVSSDVVSAYGAKLLGLPGLARTSSRPTRFHSRAAMQPPCAISSKRCCPTQSPAHAHSPM